MHEADILRAGGDVAAVEMPLSVGGCDFAAEVKVISVEGIVCRRAEPHLKGFRIVFTIEGIILIPELQLHSFSDIRQLRRDEVLRGILTIVEHESPAAGMSNHWLFDDGGVVLTMLERPVYDVALKAFTVRNRGGAAASASLSGGGDTIAFRAVGGNKGRGITDCVQAV